MVGLGDDFCLLLDLGMREYIIWLFLVNTRI